MIKLYSEEEILKILTKKNLQKRINQLAKKYKDKTVILYGAGTFFDVINKYFDLSGLNILGIADMRFNEETEYAGYKAFFYNEIYKKNCDVVLITSYESHVIEDYFENKLFPHYGKFKHESLIHKPIINNKNFKFLDKTNVFIQNKIKDFQSSKQIKPILQNNLKLKDSYKGERCFIIACGPSINTQDLTKLKNEYCITISNLFLHKDFEKINSIFHCYAEYMPVFTRQEWAENLKKMDSTLKKSTKLVTDINEKENAEKNNIFMDRDVFYIQQCSKSKNFDLTKPIMRYRTIAINAMQLAIYCGFSELYLVGFDHDWILNYKKTRHFYREEEDVRQKNNKNKNFREWKTINDFENYLKDYLKLWGQYKFVKQKALEHGIKVYNATNGGLLDMFECVDYDQINFKGE